jgi:hypothetical protein
MHVAQCYIRRRSSGPLLPRSFHCTCCPAMTVSTWLCSCAGRNTAMLIAQSKGCRRHKTAVSIMLLHCLSRAAMCCHQHCGSSQDMLQLPGLNAGTSLGSIRHQSGRKSNAVHRLLHVLSEVQSTLQDSCCHDMGPGVCSQTHFGLRLGWQDHTAALWPSRCWGSLSRSLLTGMRSQMIVLPAAQSAQGGDSPAACRAS